MVLVGRDGSTIDTITNIPSCYGAAYDNFSAGGPYLWVNTGTAAGSPATVEKFDIAAHATTGFTFQAAVTEIAGGCFIQEDIVFGTATIGVMAQGERVYGYELCSTETWLTLSNASGAIPVSGTHDVTLNFDAAGLTLGTLKTATLVFKDENNFEYSNPVNVTMTIGAATTPDITLSVATINTTAAPEATDTDSFDMGNVGDGDLDYNIATAYTSKGKAIINAEANDFESGLGYTNAGGSINWATATGDTWNSNTTCARIDASTANPASAVHTATLTSDAFDGTVCETLTLDFDQTATLNTADIEVEYYNGSAWVSIYTSSTSVTGHQAISLPVIATNMQLRFTASFKTKLGSFWCIDDIVVSGEELVTFTWLTIDSPLSGTVVPAGNTTVNMTCNATGLAEGTYTADITINSNDPDEPAEIIPVTFEVIEGSVTPTIPANVVTSISGTDLVIDWDVSANATSYDVYSSDDPYGTFTFVANVGTNQYTVPASQAKLFYYIVAKN